MQSIEISNLFSVIGILSVLSVSIQKTQIKYHQIVKKYLKVMFKKFSMYFSVCDCDSIIKKNFNCCWHCDNKRHYNSVMLNHFNSVVSLHGNNMMMRGNFIEIGQLGIKGKFFKHRESHDGIT